MYENFFTTFEITNPPPILRVELKFPKYNMIFKQNNFNTELDTELNTELENPFIILTESPTLKQSTLKPLNKQDFVNSMVNSYKRALTENGLDPNYAYALTSSAVIESAWGTKVSGKFNYGGVKAKTGTVASTIDYIPGLGNVRRNQTFRDFNSLDDYCNYMVKWLKSSKRYGNAFKLYSANQAYDFWKYILEAGYGGGSQENINNYMKSFKLIYNKINN